MFYAQVKKDFSTGFWLRVKKSNDIKAEATRKMVVGVHHPLIMKFLRSKILSYLDEEPSSPQHQSIVKVGVYFNVLTIRLLAALACVEYGKEYRFTIIEIKQYLEQLI